MINTPRNRQNEPAFTFWCMVSVLILAAIIFIPSFAFTANARAVVIAVSSGYTVKPVRGCWGRASSFRKVCRLTLWPQSEVMALMGGGWSPLCFQGSLTVSLSKHCHWARCYCRTLQHSWFKRVKMPFFSLQRKNSPERWLISMKILK